MLEAPPLHAKLTLRTRAGLLKVSVCLLSDAFFTHLWLLRAGRSVKKKKKKSSTPMPAVCLGKPPKRWLIYGNLTHHWLSTITKGDHSTSSKPES